MQVASLDLVRREFGPPVRGGSTAPASWTPSPSASSADQSKPQASSPRSTMRGAVEHDPGGRLGRTATPFYRGQTRPSVETWPGSIHPISSRHRKQCSKSRRLGSVRGIRSYSRLRYLELRHLRALELCDPRFFTALATTGCRLRDVRTCIDHASCGATRTSLDPPSRNWKPTRKPPSLRHLFSAIHRKRRYPRLVAVRSIFAHFHFDHFTTCASGKRAGQHNQLIIRFAVIRQPQYSA